MIEISNKIYTNNVLKEYALDFEGSKDVFEQALFFDLEHYVYKKPICIGVFGCCYYDKIQNCLNITQYMIENKYDVKKVLFMAEEYFKEMYFKYNKRYIITFSGNNDFTVIKYLFNKYSIKFDFDSMFKHIDLQKQYEIETKNCIGLKKLEKIFNIEREGELISGSNLAKTFSKIIRDNEYINKMPEEKKEKILLYNQQDIVSLFYIYTKWNIVEKVEHKNE
ncbi:MAG: ribonuclease H-like domain-containing protein [Bacillota bacterium]|nr:ribonuclease H-like domain-containing protein [Bacillota bacterium]